MKHRPDQRVLPDLKELFFSVALGVLFGAVLVMSDTEPPVALPLAPVSNAPRCAFPSGLLTSVACRDEKVCSPFRTVPLERFSTDRAIIPKPSAIWRRPASRPVTRPYYAKYVPVPKNISPNSVVLTRTQSPLPASAKKSKGQYVCAKKKDRGQKSGENRRAHIDRQCCLDPDEVPNPHCTY